MLLNAIKLQGRLSFTFSRTVKFRSGVSFTQKELSKKTTLYITQMTLRHIISKEKKEFHSISM